MRWEQITIVGVGLMGGSVGLAVKSRGLADRIIGVGIDADKLRRAQECGAIDSFTSDLAEGVNAADLIVVCTPVDRITPVIKSVLPHCRDRAVITDTGSTKGNVIAALDEEIGGRIRFVPAHPLAGAEKNGVEHARADLFENRLTILTPDSRLADAAAVTFVETFWRSLGSRVVHQTALDHDRILATTSHLPHAVAAAAAGITPIDWLPLSAGGFRDVTRIAGGDPELWSAIFHANRAAILSALAAFMERLRLFESLVETGDTAGLFEWLSQAKRVRDALGS